jgi:hypothetical protein
VHRKVFYSQVSELAGADRACMRKLARIGGIKRSRTQTPLLRFLPTPPFGAHRPRIPTILLQIYLESVQKCVIEYYRNIIPNQFELGAHLFRLLTFKLNTQEITLILRYLAGHVFDLR